MKLANISHYFNIEKNDILKHGIFDRIIGIDSLLYIDPFLFDGTTIPEFIGAREEIKNYFAGVVSLLKQNNSRAKKVAIQKLTFKELKGLGIGYGKDSENGKSVGPNLAEKLANSGQELIEMGILDPEIFELIGLFEEGFGPDRLSDICINILYSRFLDFTSRVTNELNITKIKQFKYKNTTIKLPFVIENKSYVLFVPVEFLRDLPVALDRESIDWIVSHNNELRKKLNLMIGEARKEKIKKDEIKTIIFSNKNNVQSLVELYKNNKKSAYDLSSDNNGEIKRYYKACEYAENNNLILNLTNKNNLYDIVMTIIETFKRNVEFNGINMYFYNDEKKPHHEKYFQRLFQMVAQIYCEANDIDISPESNAGRGPVDFKFSRGMDKVIVEIKKDSNDLISGISKQIPTYEKSENVNTSILLIFQITKNGNSINKLKEYEIEQNKKGIILPQYIIIDARIHESASHL